MEGQHFSFLGVYFAGESPGEEDVVEFRASIGKFRSVVVFEIDVWEIEVGVNAGSRHFVGEGGYVDHSESLCLLYFGPEERGEEEVSEVVDCPLHFEAFLGHSALGNGHHSCVVDEIVDFVEGNAFGEGFNRAAVCQVQRDEVNFAVGGDLFAGFNGLFCCFFVTATDQD